MRTGRPVNQRNYAARYNPIIGRRSLLDNEGAFKNTARYLSLGTTLGYDPKGGNGLFSNKPVTSSFESLNVLSNFLKKFNNKPIKTYNITHENGKHYIHIGDHTLSKHQFTKNNQYYFLITKKHYNNPHLPESQNKNVRIKIKAKDDDEFKLKLSWILNKITSRAKLDFNQVSKEVTFNEQKVIGHSDLQEFKAIGDPAIAEAFDTDIGSIDQGTINYFCRVKSYPGYSALEQRSLTQVSDLFSNRIHGMNEHILSSNRIDELLGNIINMFYADKNISAENRAQMVNHMRQDFIFNLYGKGSRNGRIHDEGKDAFPSALKFQNFYNQFFFATDPNRGGRNWRNIPPSLTQVMELMYRSKGDGSIENIYDTNPQKYLENMQNLKLTIADKQFMGAYGRKVLGIYLALKFIKHDLSFVKIDDKNVSAKDIQKWKDLTKIHDELFESLGDMKDFFRQNNSGFAQVIHSVATEKIPEIKNTLNTNFNKNISRDLYTQTTKKTLYPLMLNYTQFQNFMGWRTRDKGSAVLYDAFKNHIFDREVPDIVAGAATVMMLEGLDKISRRLKFIDEIIGGDGNLKGAIDQIVNKTQQGNIEGAYEMMLRQGKKLTAVLNAENLFPNIKYHSLHTEGLLWEREIARPIIRDYQTESKNFFVGNHLSRNLIEKNGHILTAKLIKSIKMQAHLIKNIQEEMQQKNIKSAYETDAMFVLSQYMRNAAKEIATSFMYDHKSYFARLTDEEAQKIFRDVFKEAYGIQELVGNVASILATGKEQAYSPNIDSLERDKKRNQRLEKQIKNIKHTTKETL